MAKIPVTIITGFLGSGKTTCIRHLLENKPKDEQWAVLVNEFGEIGIDGALLEDTGALVREVPGGCMCCVAGLPMQIGLSLLIGKKPDRLLVEPTGLGHPKEIVSILGGEYYRDEIELQNTLTVVDPRKIADERYTSHEIFCDQIGVADVIIANKASECSEEEKGAFKTFLEKTAKTDVQVLYTDYSAIPLSAFGGKTREAQKKSCSCCSGHDHNHSHDHHHDHVHNHSHDHEQADVEIDQMVIPEGERFMRKEKSGRGFKACGWLFDESCVFKLDSLSNIVKELSLLRLKAMLMTDAGPRSFQVIDGEFAVAEVSAVTQSRLEIITDTEDNWDELEKKLLSTLC